MLLVGGLVAFGAYKFSQRDADRIEQHTGVPPEEMSDAELDQAMDELGIEKQMRDASDAEQGAAAAPAQAAPAEDSEADQLAKLAQLHEQGVLTDEEFAAGKRNILGL